MTYLRYPRNAHFHNSGSINAARLEDIIRSMDGKRKIEHGKFHAIKGAYNKVINYFSHSFSSVSIHLFLADGLTDLRVEGAITKQLSKRL